MSCGNSAEIRYHDDNISMTYSCRYSANASFSARYCFARFYSSSLAILHTLCGCRTHAAIFRRQSTARLRGKISLSVVVVDRFIDRDIRRNIPPLFPSRYRNNNIAVGARYSVLLRHQTQSDRRDFRSFLCPFRRIECSNVLNSIKYLLHPVIIIS